MEVQTDLFRVPAAKKKVSVPVFDAEADDANPEYELISRGVVRVRGSFARCFEQSGRYRAVNIKRIGG